MPLFYLIRYMCNFIEFKVYCTNNTFLHSDIYIFISKFASLSVLP